MHTTFDHASASSIWGHPDAGKGGDPHHATQACADLRACQELLHTLGCKLESAADLMDALCNAGGNLYHELRQGKLMLMPSFTSGFQKMLKWLMAPTPGACLSFSPTQSGECPCRHTHESWLRLVLSGYTGRHHVAPSIARAVIKRPKQKAQLSWSTVFEQTAL